ncbi:MAG: hypothetical protein PHC64_09245 [Candidatus Gastranaerophilales bacterium]|nr:hypothetical protein [Candidatus Gastranaerophilales bacterium]
MKVTQIFNQSINKHHCFGKKYRPRNDADGFVCFSSASYDNNPPDRSRTKFGMTTRLQEEKISFQRGLTPEIAQAISRTDVGAVSDWFAKRHMPTDFQGNQVLAWCCQKTAMIFGQLKLGLPKGIYVIDFKQLEYKNPSKALGTCNLLPTSLIKGSDEVIPPKTIFFNSMQPWQNIDTMADAHYAEGGSSTDFFMSNPFHEFAHAAHEDWLVRMFGEGKTQRRIEMFLDEEQFTKRQEEYQRKYGNRILPGICRYALVSPLEAVACDLARVIADGLNPVTLLPPKNLLVGTPYERLPLWRRLTRSRYEDLKRPLPEVLRNFWNGEFE